MPSVALNPPSATFWRNIPPMKILISFSLFTLVIPLASPHLSLPSRSGDVGYTNEDRQAWFYTGKAPKFGVCPGVLEDGTITSLAMPDVVKATRQDILDYFDNTWTLTEVIFTALQGTFLCFETPHFPYIHQYPSGISWSRAEISPLHNSFCPLHPSRRGGLLPPSLPQPPPSHGVLLRPPRGPLH